MQSKSIRRPSPALIVAIIALVAALAGTAVALPGKNTVKSNDIAKNAVGSSDIKNNKVKGADVNEASLGQVPSAARADSAAKVDTQRHVGPVRLSEGQEQVLETRGPFTITARCVDATGDDINPEIVITTSQNNAIGYSENWGDENDFDTGEEVTLNEDTSTGPADRQFYSGYSAWVFVTEDGNTQSIGDRAYVGARVGGADCYFGVNTVF
jgi:hypothetical protein